MTRISRSSNERVCPRVQSGKTANYAATIAKAADAGFRFFIVIAGIHNNLRSQTQDRLDQDVIGTGRPGGSWKWESLTDSERDFGKPIGANWILNDPNYRVVIVIKKNASRLQKLLDWLDTQKDSTLERCPTLIIDDEADQAGINTAAHLDRVSRMELLRELVAAAIGSVRRIHGNAIRKLVHRPGRDDLTEDFT